MMDGNDLIRKSAEICGLPMNNTGNIILNSELFNPLTNANHTKMLKDKAVEMGYEYEIKSLPHNQIHFYIQFFTGDLDTSIYVQDICSVENELRTTTEAIVEAVFANSTEALNE